jgi:hypothetical protein
MSVTPAGALRPAERCRRKFLHYFPRGFLDSKYVDWERAYKWAAHERWERELGRGTFSRLMRGREFTEVARRAVTIESRTNLLFSFEKMALRDAVKSPAGAAVFASGLYDLLHGSGTKERRFTTWVEAVSQLPRRQTRVLTWPLVTVFGFLAVPDVHCFLKPMVTRRAAQAYGFGFDYRSAPNWRTYQSLLSFAERVRADQRNLGPRDMIDLQSFIWVQGSDEYPD